MKCVLVFASRQIVSFIQLYLVDRTAMRKLVHLSSKSHYKHGIYLLASTCEIVDVVCFLGQGDVFAEMMTGNLLMMAIAIGCRDAIAEVDKYVFALLAFASGALIGGRIIRAHGEPDMATNLMTVTYTVMTLALPLLFSRDSQSKI